MQLGWFRTAGGNFIDGHEALDRLGLNQSRRERQSTKPVLGKWSKGRYTRLAIAGLVEEDKCGKNTGIGWKNNRIAGLYLKPLCHRLPE